MVAFCFSNFYVGRRGRSCVDVLFAFDVTVMSVGKVNFNSFYIPSVTDSNYYVEIQYRLSLTTDTWIVIQ